MKNRRWFAPWRNEESAWVGKIGVGLLLTHTDFGLRNATHKEKFGVISSSKSLWLGCPPTTKTIDVDPLTQIFQFSKTWDFWVTPPTPIVFFVVGQPTHNEKFGVISSSKSLWVAFPNSPSSTHWSFGRTSSWRWCALASVAHVQTWTWTWPKLFHSWLVKEQFLFYLLLVKGEVHFGEGLPSSVPHNSQRHWRAKNCQNNFMWSTFSSYRHHLHVWDSWMPQQWRKLFTWKGVSGKLCQIQAGSSGLLCPTKQRLEDVSKFQPLSPRRCDNWTQRHNSCFGSGECFTLFYLGCCFQRTSVEKTASITQAKHKHQWISCLNIKQASFCNQGHWFLRDGTEQWFLSKVHWANIFFHKDEAIIIRFGSPSMPTLICLQVWKISSGSQHSIQPLYFGKTVCEAVHVWTNITHIVVECLFNKLKPRKHFNRMEGLPTHSFFSKTGISTWKHFSPMAFSSAKEEEVVRGDIK